MKFTFALEINAPLQKVVEIYTDTSNFSKWQGGFQSHQILKGKYLEVGTKSRIIYKNSNNTIELIETILANNLPGELTARYEHKDIDNTATSKFSSIDENRTRFEYQIEVIKIKGLMLKIMSTLFPNMFRKQTQRWLDNFKILAES